MLSYDAKRIRFIGRILVLVSIMTWFYRQDLMSLNFIIILNFIVKFIIHLVAKTSLFTKKETDLSTVSFKRKAKIFSLLISVFMAVIILSATAFLTMSDQVGGDLGEYDSPHYYDGKFNNLEESSVSTGSFFGTLLDYMVGSSDRSPGETVPTLPYQQTEVEENDVRITWFGHSTILVETHDTTLLFDPVFGSDNLNPLVFGPAPFDYEHTYEVSQLPEIDYVFISHDHYDHLDMSTVQSLDESMFFVPLGVDEHLKVWDIPSNQIMTFDWYDEATISEGFDIALTPSQHFSGRGATRDGALWGSWVVQIENHSIYFSGDSGYSKEFVEINNRYGPFDIAICEAGQYNEAWDEIHMYPEQAIQAAIDLNATTMIPIHNTKYILALHEWDDPLERVYQEGKRTGQHVSTPMIGESFVLGESMEDNPWWREVAKHNPWFLKTSAIIGWILPLLLLTGIGMIVHERFMNQLEEE